MTSVSWYQWIKESAARLRCRLFHDHDIEVIREGMTTRYLCGDVVSHCFEQRQWGYKGRKVSVSSISVVQCARCGALHVHRDLIQVGVNKYQALRITRPGRGSSAWERVQRAWHSLNMAIEEATLLEGDNGSSNQV